MANESCTSAAGTSMLRALRGSQMSSPSRFEIVHTGPRRFHARFKAGNSEIVWVTESLTTRRAAREAIDVIATLAGPSRARVQEVDER